MSQTQANFGNQHEKPHVHAGADWIENSLKMKCSPLGRAAANLLGDVFLGIYHMNATSLRKVDWNDPHSIVVTLSGSLCSVDFNELTRLVLLAHDRMLRVELGGLAPGYMRLMIHQRTKRKGQLYERCPTMEKHIAMLRGYYGEPVDVD